MTQPQKRQIMEATTKRIVIGKEEIEIDLLYLLTSPRADRCRPWTIFSVCRWQPRFPTTSDDAQ